MSNICTVIPAIDLIDGEVVRLTQGRYTEKTVYDVNPLKIAEELAEQGASHLHIIDLDGAKAGYPVNTDVIQSIRESTHLNIQCGGGIRTEADCEALLKAGVNQVILGSILIKDPERAHHIITQFPNQIIAGIDIKDHKIAIEGWLESSPYSIKTLAKEIENWPLYQIIVTDISKDGTLSGPNLSLLKEMGQLFNFPIGAAGGISTIEDIKAIQSSCPQVTSCIVGKAIYEGTISLEEMFKKNG